MYKHILIPTDGSELSMKAVEHGLLLARGLKARVTSITVMSSQIFDFEPTSFTELPEEWDIRSWTLLLTRPYCVVERFQLASAPDFV